MALYWYVLLYTRGSTPVIRVLVHTAPAERAERSVRVDRRRRPRSSDRSAPDSCLSSLAAPSRMPSCRCALVPTLALRGSRQFGPCQEATSTSIPHSRSHHDDSRKDSRDDFRYDSRDDLATTPARNSATPTHLSRLSGNIRAK